MLKKIQRYLLLHYPLIWNIRLIPFLLAIVVFHLLFFGISYFYTNTLFSGHHYYSYYSSFNELIVLYFFSALTGVLLLIGWLIYYNRNNAFKSLYPRNTNQLYLEWFLIFLMCTGMTLVPLSVKKGYDIKWRSASNPQEVEKAIDILNKAEVLIPDINNHLNYYEYSSTDSLIPIPDGMEMSEESIDYNLFDIRYNNYDEWHIEGYRGPSLLFYKNYSKSYTSYQNKDWRYIDRNEIKAIERMELVKRWLRDGQTDSIRTVMKDFFQLQEKHHLKSDLTVEDWFNRIYNPPFFPVNETSKISRYNCGYYTAYGDDFGYHCSEYAPYLQINELQSGYEYMQRHYNYQEDNEILILVSLCISFVLTMLIFSFRVTNRKSWLIGFIATGVLLLISFLLVITIEQSTNWHNTEVSIILFLLFWVVLFCLLAYNIISRIRNGRNKGRSDTYLNMALWLLPFIIPFLFFTFHLYLEFIDQNSAEEREVLNMFWINLAIMLPLMWLVSLIVRKWKGLPEE